MNKADYALAVKELLSMPGEKAGPARTARPSMAAEALASAGILDETAGKASAAALAVVLDPRISLENAMPGTAAYEAADLAIAEALRRKAELAASAALASKIAKAEQPAF